ncbi:MAG: glycosyltransferase [Planctomycetes bacterium]|nr:glycosyltransferase [Planctomycetota bacterium]
MTTPSDKPPTFTLLVFTWNEIESLPAVMPKVDRSLFEQILIVDANSADGTADWCRSQGYEVFLQPTHGICEAYQESLPHVRGDYSIAFSPDGNSLPEKLPELVAKLREGYDMVIVSRYLGGAKSQDDDLITGFGNWMFTRLVNLLHGARYTDAIIMYRGYRTNLVRELRLDSPQEPLIKWPARIFFARMGIEPLMSARAARAGFRVGEIPGDEPKRIGGKRKLKIIRWGLAMLTQLVLEAFIPRRRYRPAAAAAPGDKA